MSAKISDASCGQIARALATSVSGTLNVALTEWRNTKSNCCLPVRVVKHLVIEIGYAGTAALGFVEGCARLVACFVLVPLNMIAKLFKCCLPTMVTDATDYLAGKVALGGTLISIATTIDAIKALFSVCSSEVALNKTAAVGVSPFTGMVTGYQTINV
jgi:hypothetical protein